MFVWPSRGSTREGAWHTTARLFSESLPVPARVMGASRLHGSFWSISVGKNVKPSVVRTSRQLSWSTYRCGSPSSLRERHYSRTNGGRPPNQQGEPRSRRGNTDRDRDPLVEDKRTHPRKRSDRKHDRPESKRNFTELRAQFCTTYLCATH